MTDTPRPPDPDDDGTDPVGPTGDGTGADAPPVDAPAGIPADDALDASEQAVRDLLRHDEVDIDPAQRERAVLAALAVADEVFPVTAGTGVAAEPVTPTEVPLEVPHHPATVVPLPTRPRSGLRVLAVAAAIVLVGAGAVVVGGGGGSDDESTAMNDSSGQESAEAQQESADSAPGSGGASDSSTTADRDGSDESLDQETRSSPTTTAPGPAPAVTGVVPPDVVELGPQPDVASLLRAAAVAAPAGDATSSSPAPPATGRGSTPCPGVLEDLAALPLAVATIDDAPVLVVRAVDPATVPSLTVLALSDCAVLGRG